LKLIVNNKAMAAAILCSGEHHGIPT